jgi:hypothetical protein
MYVLYQKNKNMQKEWHVATKPLKKKKKIVYLITAAESTNLYLWVGPGYDISR